MPGSLHYGKGAGEFNLTALVSPSESGRLCAFFDGLREFSRPAAVRRTLSAPTRDSLTRQMELWELNARTIALLRRALPAGFASRAYDVDLWLEDLVAYRDGDLMMGVLSHVKQGTHIRSKIPWGFAPRDHSAASP